MMPSSINDWPQRYLRTRPCSPDDSGDSDSDGVKWCDYSAAPSAPAAGDPLYERVLACVAARAVVLDCLGSALNARPDDSSGDDFAGWYLSPSPYLYDAAYYWEGTELTKSMVPAKALVPRSCAQSLRTVCRRLYVGSDKPPAPDLPRYSRRTVSREVMDGAPYIAYRYVVDGVPVDPYWTYDTKTVQESESDPCMTAREWADAAFADPLAGWTVPEFAAAAGDLPDGESESEAARLLAAPVADVFAKSRLPRWSLVGSAAAGSDHVSRGPGSFWARHSRSEIAEDDWDADDPDGPHETYRCRKYGYEDANHDRDVDWKSGDCASPGESSGDESSGGPWSAEESVPDDWEWGAQESESGSESGSYVLGRSAVAEPLERALVDAGQEMLFPGACSGFRADVEIVPFVVVAVSADAEGHEVIGTPTVPPPYSGDDGASAQVTVFGQRSSSSHLTRVVRLPPVVATVEAEERVVDGRRALYPAWSGRGVYPDGRVRFWSRSAALRDLKAEALRSLAPLDGSVQRTGGFYLNDSYSREEFRGPVETAWASVSVEAVFFAVKCDFCL